MPDQRDPAATTIIRSRGFFKSSFSNGSCACLEVRFGATVAIRDSKHRRDPARAHLPETVLHVDQEAFRLWLGEVTGDREPGANGVLAVHHDDDGATTVEALATGQRLWFTAEEWVAFVAGVAVGEFTPDAVATA